MDVILYNKVNKKPDNESVLEATEDFYVADEEGNTIIEVGHGEVKTKNFNSAKASVTRPTTTDEDFVICDSSGNVILKIENGHVKTKRFNSLNVKPNIITVRLDGTGDFTNIREAVESITDADAVNNPYVIEIYEGTYNICDYYTQAEIESAGEEHYTDNSFVGLKLTDGISLRGVGCREKIILNGYLDPSLYTMANRNNIATLNTQGEMSLENLTVIGENVRYAVHDDFHSDFRATNKRNPKRVLKNCVFVGISTTGGAAYGAGSSTGRDYEVVECVFDREAFGLHMSTGMVYSSSIVFENCTGVGISLGDYSSAATDAVHSVTLNNCNIGSLGIFKANNGSYNAQHLEFFGTGGNDPFFTVPSGFVYQNGSVIKTKTVLSLADAVDADFSTATADSIYGVCIGTYNGYSYVQRKGYILASLLGLTASAGDYAGVSAGKVVIQNTAADSIGKVIERNNKAYIKLTI